MLERISSIYNGKNRYIKVYHTLNVRFILEDLFAKLELFALDEI